MNRSVYPLILSFIRGWSGLGGPPAMIMPTERGPLIKQPVKAAFPH